MNQAKRTRSLHRVAWVLTTVVLVVATAAGTWWAARMTIVPGSAPTDPSSAAVTATVVEGSVGRSVPVSVTLRQPVDVVATNTLAGMVTSVAAGGEVTVGNVVYAVGGVPVRVVKGSVPFYRDLDDGMKGPDVAQLEEALVSLGYLSDKPDDYYGAATVTAVRAWQVALGVEPTGSVTWGEVLAVPSLPAKTRLGDAIRLGTLVSGGEPALLMASGTREFTLVLSADQAAVVTTDVPIRVTYQGLTWDARITGSRSDEMGHTVLDLIGADGGPVCGSDCDRLPADEQLSLRGQAIVVPEVSGPVVPVTAVRTAVDGRVYVVMADGTERTITVRGSAQGLAVVDGLALGDRVVVSGG